MYSFQHNDKADIAGVMEMVRRGCERLYRIGMSDRPGLAAARKFAKMTTMQRDEALLLGMEGELDVVAIANAVGHSPHAVRKLFQRNKIACKKRPATRSKKGAQ
jgi:hypothetical protein